MNRDPQTIPIKTKDVGDQIPRPGNGVVLEVVAKTEVAQHLKEDEVALSTTNVVEVVVFASRAHTLLHGDCPVAGSNFIAHEVRLERHHSSHREQQCWVVRNQAG